MRPHKVLDAIEQGAWPIRWGAWCDCLTCKQWRPRLRRTLGAVATKHSGNRERKARYSIAPSTLETVTSEPPVTGVLLMAHGTPASLDEMPEYLRLVRGGRPPSPELVAEMRHNYQAIGGRSPLTEITMAQGEASHKVRADRVCQRLRLCWL